MLLVGRGLGSGATIGGVVLGGYSAGAGPPVPAWILGQEEGMLPSTGGRGRVIADDLDWAQGFLGDAATIGEDGRLWSRAELLDYYNQGYRALLTQSQAIKRWVVLDTPGRFTFAISQEWETRLTEGGSSWKPTWSAPGGYACTSIWETQLLEGLEPDNATEGITQEWERQFLNPAQQYYRFALPRDNERIAGMWFDHRRLGVTSVVQLDQFMTHWMSMGDYPLAWLQGVGRSRTVEVYEISTVDGQGYSQQYTPQGRQLGIPRYYSGARTYATATSQLMGIARRIMSPDRQYLATVGVLGSPRIYHTSLGNLLILEVVGPEIPALTEDQAPNLLPQQMWKYLNYYVMMMAWERQGEGQQLQLSAICQQMFLRGVRVLKNLSWLTRSAETFQRTPVGQQGRRIPKVRLPSTYQRIW